MRRLLFAVGFVVGCEEEAPPPPPPPVAVEKADTGEAAEETKEQEPEKPVRTPAQAAHDLMLAGQFAEASAAAAKLEDRALGARLQRVAARAGGPVPTDASAVFNAELALESGKAQAAFDALFPSLGDDLGDAAVVVARAIAAGAVLPEESELPRPVAAMAKWIASPDARSARGFAAQATLLTGAAADLVRADKALAWGDSAALNAANEVLVQSADPQIKLRGLLGKLDGHQSGTVKGLSSDAVYAMATEADSLAQAEGSLQQLKSALGHAVQASKRMNDFGGALAIAQAHLDTAKAAGTDPGLALALAADAALLSGSPVLAADHAAAALAIEGEAGDAVRASASWTAGLAAWQLGRGEALDAASAAATGPQKDALKGLAAVHRGDVETARLQFPPSGLDGEAAAHVYGVAASIDAANAGAWYDKSIAGADASGVDALRVSTRLAKESWIRTFNRRGAAKLRQATSRINASPALKGELSVRGFLAGSPGGVSGDAGPATGVWQALTSTSMPQKIEGDTWTGLLQWARGRAAAASGRLEGHDGHFPASLSNLPLHRKGRLALGTVVDGSEGVDLETDVRLLSAIGGETATGLALSAHDIGHRQGVALLDISMGRNQLFGIPNEDKEALLVAIAKARADITAWQVGRGDFPTASIEAVAAAEAKASEGSEAFKSLMPIKGATAAELLSDLRRGAVISYRAAHGSVQAIALSREGNGIKDLGSSREIFKLAEDYLHAMRVSAPDSKVQTDHSSGHFLRTKIIDPFIGELTGVGKYVIVGPPELTSFPFTTLPEQAEGLRWLADIRQMASAPTVSTLVRDLREVNPDTFKLDFLAFGGEEKAPNENELTDFETPNELKVSGRYFQSGIDEVLTGPDAVLSVWREKAAAARYIHLSELTPTMNGGFKFADGALSLDEVRNTKLHADMVVITARGTPAQQQQRARAFLDAGSEWVLVTNWGLPDRFRVRYLGNIYDSMNQERPPIRAMSEGRNRMINDGMTSVNMDDPAMWGVFTLFGKP